MNTLEQVVHFIRLQPGIQTGDRVPDKTACNLDSSKTWITPFRHSVTCKNCIAIEEHNAGNPAR